YSTSFAVFSCPLLSFPTRRSSDLGTTAITGASRFVQEIVPPFARDSLQAGNHFSVHDDAAAYAGSHDHSKDYFRFVQKGFSGAQDRKSTRLNSSHVKISYAVFRLK